MNLKLLDYKNHSWSPIDKTRDREVILHMCVCVCVCARVCVEGGEQTETVNASILKKNAHLPSSQNQAQE
jgi:hypothetical protein